MTKLRTRKEKSSGPSAGDYDTCEDFIQVPEREAPLAAYVGYDDIAELRKFVLSHHFLKYAILVKKDWAHHVRVKAVLASIRDNFLTSNQQDTYPTAFAHLGKYQVADDFDREDKETRVMREKHMAHILVIMVAECESLGDGAEVAVHAELQKNFSQQLQQTLRPGQIVPAILSTTIAWPQLIAEGLYEESALEPYNRAHNLLNYFRFLASSEERWRNRFASPTWAQQTMVTEQYIPPWMRPRPTVEPAMHFDTEALAALEPLDLWLLHKPKGGDQAHQDALREHLRAEWHEGRENLPKLLRADADPRACSEEYFRDTIRQQFDCEGWKIQLLDLTVEVSAHGNEDDVTLDLLTGDWLDFLDAIVEVGSSASFVIEVRFTPLQEGEALYESSESPPRMQELVKSYEDIIRSVQDEA